MSTLTRLIETFIPTHYDLSLQLEREARRFAGTVTIQGKAVTEAPIRLHSKDLTIHSVVLNGKTAAFTQENNELHIDHAAVGGTDHLITIAFEGTITDSMHGLYPCYYQHEGEKKELLATQFESHHAREVFPCIDEPSAKATFDVTLTTEPGVVVLGNMPVTLEREENGMLVTSFATTPRMSTYLLAWVVGELHKKSGQTASGVEVNIWATPAQTAESLDFALDIATRTIEFFDDYFGTPYPLPKSDHVALPDFSSGAMENWGLITYREVALLADPQTASLENKRQVALVVAHELSHQWFGNLVTMAWWNDLWLNESFANMMEYVVIDKLEPDWKVWLDHASYEVTQALGRDSLDGVQAIQSDVTHPDEISSLFDPSIVYAKGGRLLRMLQNYVGDEIMQKGLKEYFATYAYQNTVADDLWNCIAKASGEDIKGLMNAWITQSGFPVVHVTRNGNGTLHLIQEQFFIGEHGESDKLWPIPLGSLDPAFPALLTEKETLVTPSEGGSLILNHESTAHYLTHYSPELLEEVLEDLESYGDIDRLKLLNEYALLARAEVVSTADIIRILDHYQNESSEAVWGIMALAINELKKFVEDDTESEKKLKALVGRLSRSQYERLGWDQQEGENEADTKLRGLIIGLMLYSDDEQATQEALRRYQETPLEALDPNIRVTIMANAVRQSTPATVVDDLLKIHNESSSSEMREDIAAALTSTKDTAVVEQLLGYLKDPSIVRAQDVTRWYAWLLRNRYGRDIAWQWVQDNWGWLEETFGGDKSYDIYPRFIASSLKTSADLEAYKNFFTPLRDQKALKRNIDIGLVELAQRVALLESEGPRVRKALLDLN